MKAMSQSCTNTITTLSPSPRTSTGPDMAMTTSNFSKARPILCTCNYSNIYIPMVFSNKKADFFKKIEWAGSWCLVCFLSGPLLPRTHQILASVKSIPQTKLSLNATKERRFAAARCVASGSGYAAAVKPITPEEEEELTKRKSICGGEANRGMWELLECLEKEAIMGDDDGRDPKDYNRRAKIFDKSSKIFKKIKEQRDDHSPE